MGNFNRNNNSGRGRDRGGNRGGGGFRDRERPDMHQAVCSDCGRDCEVPFRPTGDKPVFCSDCFKNKDKGDSRRPERGDSRRSNFEEKKMYSAVCATCGDDCEVPFRPTGDKPVYCSQCFGKGDNDRSEARPEQSSKQLEMINSKLDKILSLFAPVTAKAATKEEPKKIEAPKAKKTEKKADKEEVKAKIAPKKVKAKKKK